MTCRYPSALFLGAGGYPRQLAGNVWNCPGAPERDNGATGLNEVELLAEAGILAAARTRCRDDGLLLVEDGDALLVWDPWGTHLRLTPMPGSGRFGRGAALKPGRASAGGTRWATYRRRT